MSENTIYIHIIELTKQPFYAKLRSHFPINVITKSTWLYALNREGEVCGQKGSSVRKLKAYYFLKRSKIERFLWSLEFCHFKMSYMCPRKSVHSMRLLFRLIFGWDSGFYLRHQDQSFSKYRRKWHQNCLFTFPLKWRKCGKI